MIDLKKETAKRLRDIPESTIFQLFSVGLITEHTAKQFLINDEFKEQSPEKGRITEVKEHIADKYCVSVDLVQKITAKKSFI